MSTPRLLAVVMMFGPVASGNGTPAEELGRLFQDSSVGAAMGAKNLLQLSSLLEKSPLSRLWAGAPLNGLLTTIRAAAKLPAATSLHYKLRIVTVPSSGRFHGIIVPPDSRTDFKLLIQPRGEMDETPASK